MGAAACLARAMAVSAVRTLWLSLPSVNTTMAFFPARPARLRFTRTRASYKAVAPSARVRRMAGSAAALSCRREWDRRQCYARFRVAREGPAGRNHVDPRNPSPNHGEQFKAGHSRHVEIGEQDIRFLFPYLLQGRKAVFGGPYRVAKVTEYLTE